jgi:hypothetical protein
LEAAKKPSSVIILNKMRFLIVRSSILRSWVVAR